MSGRVSELTQKMELNASSSREALIHLQSAIGLDLPVDYTEFMLRSNGREGSIGHNGYLVLWKTDNILPWNDWYGVSEFAHGLILFGSDGGDTVYAFDTRFKEPQIVEVPFIGMDLSEVKRIGASFVEFLEYLSGT